MSNVPQSDMPSPTANPMKQAPQKSGGKTCLKVFLVLLGLGVVSCVICGLGTYFWAWPAMMKMAGENAKSQFENHEVVIDKLGGIDSCEMSIEELRNYVEANEPTAGKSYNVFVVEGPKGKGMIVAEVAMGSTTYSNAILIIDGEEFELD